MDDLGVYVLEDNLVFMFPTNLRVKALNTERWGSLIARLAVWTRFTLRVSVLENKSDPLYRLNFRFSTPPGRHAGRAARAPLERLHRKRHSRVVLGEMNSARYLTNLYFR